jgi:23S rRNA pseudouridine2457 synthase
MPGQIRYFLFYKPFGVLSQFSPAGKRPTLASFGPFPPDVYPVGRLDADSEGLLLLTNDNRMKHLLTDPRFGHTRIYLVEVERIPDERSLDQLRTGVAIGGKTTRPAEVHLLDAVPDLPPRPVPVRFRKSVPTAWLRLTLREGRNHQVRRMTAAVGHPTLRLVRTHMGTLSLGGLAPGSMRLVEPQEIDALLAVMKSR